MFDYLNSRILHELCDGNRLLLTECRRSDKELFDFSLSLRKQDFKIKEEEHPTSICFTNAKRIERNRYWMDKLAPNCNVIVKALSWDPNSQDTRVNNKQFDIAIVHKPRRIAFRHDFRSDFCVQKYHPSLLLLFSSSSPLISPPSRVGHLLSIMSLESCLLFSFPFDQGNSKAILS